MVLKKSRRRVKPRPKAPVLLQQELGLRETDVICGRGSGVTGWFGNLDFRYLCYKVKPIYARADRAAKADIALDLVNEVASLDPPGRFVELIEGTEITDGRCVLVPLSQAVEKTCQALREKKNGCPRQFRQFEIAKEVKGDIKHKPIFNKDCIERIRRSLATKYSQSLRAKSKRTPNVDRNERNDSDDDSEVETDVELEAKVKKYSTKPMSRTTSRRLTARQAILESKKAVKQTSLKRKEVEPDMLADIVTQNQDTHLRPSIGKTIPPPRPMKKPKLVASPVDALRTDKLAVAKRAELTTNHCKTRAINTSETFKPIEHILQVPPQLAWEKRPSALNIGHKAPSTTQLDQEMALLPPTMTAFCSGIFSNMMTPTAIVETPIRRRFPGKAPRKSHNMLPLDFPPIQPILMDERASSTAHPTTLKPTITEGSSVWGLAVENTPPPTALASYLSDFFDKKYFPVHSTSRFFSGTDCQVAPLQYSMAPPSLSRSPTTVFDDLPFDDSSIVSYNQPFFDDDLDDKLMPIEAFPLR